MRQLKMAICIVTFVSTFMTRAMLKFGTEHDLITEKSTTTVCEVSSTIHP